MLRTFTRLAAVLLSLAAVPAAFGQTACNCSLALKTGSTVNTIDGVVDGEWNDASILDTAADPTCLRPVPDWNHSDPDPINALVDKNVKVYSKRDATFLYLAFQIPDETQKRQDPQSNGGQLLLGERVSIQIDPNASRGAQLGSGGGAIQKDYRLEIYHKWSTGGGGAITLPGDGIQWFDSSTTAANSPCNMQDWASQGAPAGLLAAAHNDGTGYTLEVRIPLAAMGGPTTDVGLAFAIVNDLGHCVNGACDSTGSGFPSSLALNNVSGPLLTNDPAGCGVWRSPNNFGTGYFSNTTPSLFLTHNTVYWESTDIEVRACNNQVADYQYFPATPCQLIINAHVENTGAAAQTRNILFMFADNGPSPSTWRVVALAENQSIAAGGSTIPSGVWTTVPKNLPSHPCVRVYILPNTFNPAFDRAHVLAISTAADLAQMESVYNVPAGSSCNAQKNLSAAAANTTCPFANCSVIGMRQQPALPSFFSRLLNRIVYAQPPAAKSPIFWNADERARFQATNVAVQVRAYGRAPLRLTTRPIYNFLEDLGGTIQMIPAELLKQRGQMPIVVAVGNPGNFERTISLHVDTYAPPGFGPFTANINRGPFQLGPGAQQNVSGTASATSGGDGGGRKCFGKGSAGSGVLLLFGLLVLGRHTLRRS